MTLDVNLGIIITASHNHFSHVRRCFVLAVPALSPNEISDMKNTALVFGMSAADFVRKAVREYVEQKKREPFYRLTANIEEADPEESAEILALIDSMTEDDHEVVRVDRLIMCSEYKSCPLRVLSERQPLAQ